MMEPANMNESEFLSTLLPSSPDFQPIIQALREKYSLYEVDAEGDPSFHPIIKNSPNISMSP
jgi:hypothetical protein